MAHAHPNRHHHESSFFSPYSRAYDINHPPHLPHVTAVDCLALTSPPSEPLPTSPSPATTNVTLPSACNCGDGCSCPGCFHNTNTPFTPSPSAHSTCQNPSSCHTCLDCTILSLPPDAALSIPEPQQAEMIDEWIRQMSSDVAWDDGVRQQYSAAASVTDEPVGTSPQPSAAIVAPDMMASSSFPAFSTNENMFMSDVDAFRSRSSSISPHNNGGDQFPSHLFNGDDRLSAPQQSMYINGRGFYSDPYLCLASSDSCGGDALSSAVYLPPATNVTDFDFAHQHLQQHNEVPVTYAVSNPDSDTSSTSFESSGDEQHSSLGGGSAPTLVHPTSSLQGRQRHSLSVSPVSFNNRIL